MAHGFSCPWARRNQFPNQGSNLRPLNWKADSLPLDHQGSPLLYIFRILFLSSSWLVVSKWLLQLQPLYPCPGHQEGEGSKCRGIHLSVKTFFWKSHSLTFDFPFIAHLYLKGKVGNIVLSVPIGNPNNMSPIVMKNGEWVWGRQERISTIIQILPNFHKYM